MASGSIYQLLQSPDDQRAKRLQVRSLLDEQAMRGLQRQQFEQGVADEQEVRRLSAEAGGDLGRLSDLLGARGLYKPAQAIRTQIQAGQKTAADISNAEAQAAKLRAETLIKNIGISRDELARVNDDEGYQRWTRIAGALLPEQMMQGLPQAFDPAWRDKTILTADEVLARSRPDVQFVNAGGSMVPVNRNAPNLTPIPVTMSPADASAAANRPFSIGPDGQSLPNVPVQQYETNRAAAGATRVNVPVSVNTERQFFSQVADAVGKQVADASEKARGAVSTVGTLQQISNALDSGIVMAGPGTTARVFLGQLGQAIGVGGANDADRLNKTREVIQGLARLELDTAQSMRGQGSITDTERALIRQAALGNIDSMTVNEMRTLVNVIDRSARSTIRAHRTNVDQLRNQPGAAPILPFLDSIQEPPPRAVPQTGSQASPLGGSSQAPNRGIDALLNKYDPLPP
jgi:hypothetical protein